MTKLVEKRQINRFALLLACTYMVSYITRINFGAIVSEMEASTGFPRKLLSVVLTGNSITYATGQVVSGILGDRISPKKLISSGLAVTVLMNLLIPVCNNPYQMLAVWCVNGFAQSFMWPPLVRMMSATLSEEDYKVVSTKVSWGCSAGTILVYLVAPVVISVWNWRSVFVLSAVCGIIMFFVWNRQAQDISRETTSVGTKNLQKGKAAVLFTPLVMGIMLAIVLQGMLRDGVTTWMPTYISETYQISTIVSILTGVILPIFSVLCYQTALRLYRKVLTNPVACACVVFGIGILSAVSLFFVAQESAALSVLLSALLTGCMHGVNLMLITMLPPFFKKYNAVATASGVLNSCTYIGSAVSTYGVAVLSENIGWRYTILIWAIIALAGTLACALCAKPWKRQFMSE